MRKIGVIGAMELEIDAYADVTENAAVKTVSGVTFKTGKIRGVEVVLVVSGVGKVNAAFVTALLISEFSVTEIVNTGVAGGIGVKPLETVLASACCQHDVDTTALGDPAGFISGGGIDAVFLKTDEAMLKRFQKAMPDAVTGIIATGDAFIAEKTKCEQIKRLFGASAVDCESCAVLQVAIRFGVPAMIVRTISDGADEDGKTSFTQLAAAAARRAKAAVVDYIGLSEGEL